MLVVTRKTDERIVINGDVWVQVVEVRGNRVKLGIVAPRDVEVLREEIYQAKRTREAVSQ